MTVFKAGKTWRAQIFYKGRRVASKRFERKSDAVLWEAEQQRRAAPHYGNRTFADLLDRYRREITPTKAGQDWEAARIGYFERGELADILVAELTPSRIADFRDNRLKTVSGSTVNRDFNLLSNVCRFAIKEWGWMEINPFSNVKRPKENDARDRVVTDEEVTYFSHF